MGVFGRRWLNLNATLMVVSAEHSLLHQPYWVLYLVRRSRLDSKPLILTTTEEIYCDYPVLL